MAPLPATQKILALALLLLLSSSLIPSLAHSKTFDEWVAQGWDAGCEDSTNGFLNQTVGKNTPFTKGYDLGFAECSASNAVNDTSNIGIQNDSSIVAQDTGGRPLDEILQNTNGSTVESSSTEPGYDFGCDDAGITNPSERYLEQPGNGPEFQTEEFMTQYYNGFYSCGGGTSYGGTLGSQESVPLFEETPRNTEDDSGEIPLDFDGEQSNNQPSQPSQSGGMDWIKTCNDLQAALVSSCDVLVNPDNTLTAEGERAVGCIRNGIALAGGGTLLASLPLPLIIGALKALEDPTGCGGIVEWGSIGNVGDLQGNVKLLT